MSPSATPEFRGKPRPFGLARHLHSTLYLLDSRSTCPFIQVRQKRSPEDHHARRAGRTQGPAQRTYLTLQATRTLATRWVHGDRGPATSLGALGSTAAEQRANGRALGYNGRETPRRKLTRHEAERHLHQGLPRVDAALGDAAE